METVDNLNIIFVGLPGVGKSFIGKKLAKLLVHFSYIDVDEKIEEETGLSIVEIFEKHGEIYFREIEARIIKEISQLKNQIISVGGGAFDCEDNIKALKLNGIVFYLHAPVDEIYERIKDEKQRPLLNNQNPKMILKNILKKREKNYLKADFQINTAKRQVYTILDDILGKYENYAEQKSLC